MVVDLVNVLVDAFVVKQLVNEIVPSILHHEAPDQLSYYDIPGQIYKQPLSPSHFIIVIYTVIT